MSETNADERAPTLAEQIEYVKGSIYYYTHQRSGEHETAATYRAILASLERLQRQDAAQDKYDRAMSEALNTGDGSYRP